MLRNIITALIKLFPPIKIIKARLDPQIKNYITQEKQHEEFLVWVIKSLLQTFFFKGYVYCMPRIRPQFHTGVLTSTFPFLITKQRLILAYRTNYSKQIEVSVGFTRNGS